MNQISPPPTTAQHQSSTASSPAENFLQELKQQLPAGYALKNGRLHAVTHVGKLGNAICSPVKVAALVRNPEGRGWARLVQVLPPDGRMVECIVPHAEIEARTSDAIARLADCGLQVHGEREQVIHFLKSWTAVGHALHIDQTGWTSDRTAFVLADGSVTAPITTNESVLYSGTINRFRSGSLEGWTSGIAAFAFGNPFMIFAISLAFSGPFLALTDRTGAIFHLHGKTSRGKTKALQAALSVWPMDGKEFSWSSTSSGLEGLLVEANDTFLALDELPDEPHAGFGHDIYAAANGSGKNRATVTGTAQARQTWRTSVLSSGEAPVRKVLRDQGYSLRGGQGVRMIDIPVPATEDGIFDTLHGHASSAAFVREIERVALRDSGHAGAEMVRRLIKLNQNDQLKPVLENTHRAEREKLMQALGLDPQATSNEILRVLDRFALIAMAGEIACRMQITGWPEGTASKAVMQIANAWREGRGSDAPTDDIAAIEATRDYLQQYGDSRFAPLPKSMDTFEAPAARSHEAAGYRDDAYFYIFKSAFDGIQRNRDVKYAAEGLKAAGYLKPGNERNSLQYRLPGLGKQRPRVYRISADILAA